MNFFAAQEEARKTSRKLVLWFSLCLLAVIVLVYIVLMVGLNHLATGSAEPMAAAPTPPGWWHPGIFLFTFVVVGGIILTGSLSKIAQLSAGGSVVASSLGGRQVDPSTREPLERRLLNVVEEMAIASGLPVPEVWIMDEEQGINAFAAGTDTGNAVIGVTRGTLERLTRNELQGVVAHEYSHILNGDMKLNMRLTGWIFGLVMIAILGRMLVQSLRYIRGSRNSKGGGVVVGIALLGIAVWIIGSVGVLFARILQAAISRQREFLADASAVQFTRYPEGIAGALKKIGGYAEHGAIKSPTAAQTRHMFFASSSLSSMLATHPPLEERIRAIEPNWKGRMLEGGSDPVSPDEFRKSAAVGSLPVSGFSATAGASPLPAENTDLSGEAAAAAAPCVSDAKAGLYSLLLDADNTDQGRTILASHGNEPMVIEHAVSLATGARAIATQDKLARIDAALPLLRRMSVEEARAFLNSVKGLVEADGQIDLFEFMLQQVCQRQLEIGLGIRRPPAIRYKRIAELEGEVAALLAVFAAISGDPDALQPAGVEYEEHTGRALPQVAMDFVAASEALPRMDASTPLVKRQILRLCLLTVHQDGQVNDSEAEMLRAVAEALGCGLPRQDNDFPDLG